MREKKVSKPARRSSEMQSLIDIVKHNMKKISYGAVNISDIEAERIIAKKVVDAELIRIM